MTTLFQYLPILLLATSRVPLAIAQSPDPRAQACQTAYQIVSICVSATPSLSTATAFSSTAPCACYSSSTWAPGVFDHYHASCYNYYSTVSPQLISQATSYFRGPIPSNPCALAGNLLGATRTATETVLDLPQTRDPAYAPCLYVQSIASSCAAASPGLYSSMPRDEASRAAASCLCYGSGGVGGVQTAWKPMLYDNSWSSCIDYFKTSNPAQYTSITASPGFEITPCAKIGDVRSLGFAASVATRTSSLLPTATKSATSSANGRVGVGNLDRGYWLLFLTSLVPITSLLNCVLF